jgi:hypothetical protein
MMSAFFTIVQMLLSDTSRRCYPGLTAQIAPFVVRIVNRKDQSLHLTHTVL